MKTYSILAFCLVTVLTPARFLRGQNLGYAFDTIHLMQPEYYSDNFSLDDTLISMISIQKSAPVQMNDVQFKMGGNILGGLATIVTGIGFGSAKSVNWYLSSAIRTSNPKLDWVLDVYCPGYIEKERTRVKNSDGSYSVETNYVNKFSWNEGALGFIIEAGDTIGWHYVSRFPRSDTAVMKWAQIVYKGNVEHKTLNYREFGLFGQLAGKESDILFNTDDNRIYLFSGSELTGMYQCQKPPEFKLSKKKRKTFVQPYLLVNNKITGWERMDVLRLAMEGLRMKSAVESY